MKPQRLPKEPSQVDWARLAAFIDGEGHIRIHEHYTTHARKHGWGPTLYVHVLISNTDPRLMVWLREVFGGAVNPNRGFKVGRPWKPDFRWTIASRFAAMILGGCLPYFILKKEQAEIALAFQATIGHQGKRVSEEIKNKRYALKAQLKSMTARGTAVIQ